MFTAARTLHAAPVSRALSLAAVEAVAGFRRDPDARTVRTFVGGMACHVTIAEAASLWRIAIAGAGPLTGF